MMTLARVLSPFASLGTERRGTAYYHSGRVTRFDVHDGEVHAVVQGGARYDVRLRAEGRVVSGACTCVYFYDRLALCKHLWAVILECDARGITLVRPSARAHDVDFYADEELAKEAESSLPAPRRPAAWRQALAAVTSQPPQGPSEQRPPGQLLYVIDVAGSQSAGRLALQLMTQERKKNGEWGTPKPMRLTSARLAALDDEDRRIVDHLAGASPLPTYWPYATSYDLPSLYHLRGHLALDLMPAICATGRCRLATRPEAARTRDQAARPHDEAMPVLQWDDAGPWRFELDITADDAAGEYVVNGRLRRGSEIRAIGEALLVAEEGLVVTATHVARLEHGGAMPWIAAILARGDIRVPIAEAASLRNALLITSPPAALLPEALRIDVRAIAPVPIVTFRTQERDRFRAAASLSFDYGGVPVPYDDTTPLVMSADAKVAMRRDAGAERTFAARLQELGVRPMWDAWARRQLLQIAGAQIPRLARTLTAEGWRVEHDGHDYLLPASETPALHVERAPEDEDRDAQPIDWFDLRGEVQFGSERVALPRLLAALERGDQVIALDDGSWGVLPESWRDAYGALAIGKKHGDSLRFSRAQALLLDAVLAGRPSVSWDEAFARMRTRLESFDRIEPVDAPDTFAGTLRGYQREGLGWLNFLRELGFGGCLADDMGLGKTIMVLALLERRRLENARPGGARRPSLVVAPRSVIFNWRQEAARFAPGLRVLDYSGMARAGQQHLIEDSDLVLVTYGTLRRDVERLASRTFDYVVLDEAQTIKNAGTAAAKAARALRADHRLALTGTPIENRLADLWSLFEFLNPGLLSVSSGFAKAFGGKDVSDETLRMLGRGLRPFILRRTKEQVARELPEKTEQTIECELERPQRILYNELRDHYRRQLLNGSSSWQRSKLRVLEALLRLRQAACHPGLIDPARASDKSAKLDLLVPRLVETTEEGHKTLVFSQFTSFLALLRAKLDAQRIDYEYLDGRTKDRQPIVERFQNDPECRLFLISLKAGGVGLNLTAADYVFLLDPWWNPAVEAQAVDRTHRIGQTRNVFAYRLIARDTVEERVLELQQRKRKLADAILTADNSLVRHLQREDLELLLS